MTVEEAIATFSSFSPDEQKEFVAQLMYELTVVVRDSYEAGGDGLSAPPRVRRINEVQHRLAAHLGKLLRGDSERYPDDVLIRIALEHEGDAELEGQTRAAFAAAHRLTVGVSLGQS
jgi:hypothetical protein